MCERGRAVGLGDTGVNQQDTLKRHAQWGDGAAGNGTHGQVQEREVDKGRNR